MLIKLTNRIINMDHVAWIAKEGTGVTVHFAVPQATVVPNLSYRVDATPPVATDHYFEQFNGDDAVAIWEQVSGNQYVPSVN